MTPLAVLYVYYITALTTPRRDGQAESSTWLCACLQCALKDTTVTAVRSGVTAPITPRVTLTPGSVDARLAGLGNFAISVRLRILHIYLINFTPCK